VRSRDNISQMQADAAAAVDASSSDADVSVADSQCHHCMQYRRTEGRLDGWIIQPSRSTQPSTLYGMVK